MLPPRLIVVLVSFIITLFLTLKVFSILALVPNMLVFIF
jgi:hypothetical protein